MSRRRDRIEIVHAVRPVVAGLLAVGLVAVSTAAQDRPTLASFAGANCFTTLWEGELEAGARVVSSRQPLQITFGTGEIVFLEGPGAPALTPGAVYRLVRLEGDDEVVAADGSSLGHAVSFVGEITVLDVDAERALAEVALACQGVELGDFVGPPLDVRLPELTALDPFDPRRLIQPSEDDATVLLGAVDTLMGDSVEAARRQTEARRTYALGDVVTIDRGAADGWVVGDVVHFYRSEAEAVYQVAGEVTTPPRLSARGVIFWTQQGSATVMVTDGDQAVSVGSRARRVSPVEE